ncbi:hypothetical protein [Tumebacillus lipolyticus]|uniref:Alcohol dehydrogenase N-terminal domain-containing protein n=1 Tax=Tumebacillus lipolyticus TaxID=1280370 RepID=A0ABW4ZXY8_9BACL
MNRAVNAVYIVSDFSGIGRIEQHFEVGHQFALESSRAGWLNGCRRCQGCEQRQQQHDDCQQGLDPAFFHRTIPFVCKIISCEIGANA